MVIVSSESHTKAGLSDLLCRYWKLLAFQGESFLQWVLRRHAQGYEAITGDWMHPLVFSTTKRHDHWEMPPTSGKLPQFSWIQMFQCTLGLEPGSIWLTWQMTFHFMIVHWIKSWKQPGHKATSWTIHDYDFLFLLAFSICLKTLVECSLLYVFGTI